MDGWLGFMVGTELWYPLWSSDMIQTTSTELAKLIGDNARSQGLGGTASTHTTHTINSTLSSASTIVMKSVQATDSTGGVTGGSGNGALPVTTTTSSTTNTTSSNTTTATSNTPSVDHLSVAWAVLQDSKFITKPVRRHHN